MQVLELTNNYLQEIRQVPYLYRTQKLALDLFRDYLMQYNMNITEEDLDKELFNEVLLYYIPTVRPHLSVKEKKRIITTIQKLYNYIRYQATNDEEILEDTSVYDDYLDEFTRIYNASAAILPITAEPIISYFPIIIDITKYRAKQNEEIEVFASFEDDLFEIVEIKKYKSSKLIVMTKLGCLKTYKCVVSYSVCTNLRVGDIMHLKLKKNMFKRHATIENLYEYYSGEVKGIILEHSKKEINECKKINSDRMSINI